MLTDGLKLNNANNYFILLWGPNKTKSKPPVWKPEFLAPKFIPLPLMTDVGGQRQEIMAVASEVAPQQNWNAVLGFLVSTNISAFNRKNKNKILVF